MEAGRIRIAYDWEALSLLTVIGSLWQDLGGRVT